MMINVTPESTLTCPNCGEEVSETMPTDSCQFFWQCLYCKEVAKPQQGDCCVFCSYGSVACPPVQQKKTAADYHE